MGPQGTLSPAQVAAEVLAGLGASSAPPSSVAALEAWQAVEGGAGPQYGDPANTAAYNPYNTTLRVPGSKTVSGGPAAKAGVQAYSSWQQGIAATVATLSEPAYAGVVSDLVSGAPTAVTEEAIVSSPWGTKNIGGLSSAGQSPLSANAATSPASSASAASPSSANTGSLMNQVGGASAGVLGSVFGPTLEVLVSVVLVAGALALLVLGVSRLLPGRGVDLAALAA